MESKTLKARLHQLLVKAEQYEGLRLAELSRSEFLTKEVALAKGRQSLAEEVANVFNALQVRAHERSLGAFERLLTAILNDVLPGEGRVKLIPEYKNNTTWLDVVLDKGGHPEDIYEANGGAVTSVMSTGLRFAALSRTKNRRVMVLDEPDGWLQYPKLPGFVKAVSDVSVQAKVQTFYISHRDKDYFLNHFNVVELVQEEDKIVAKTPHPIRFDWESDDQPGIRGLELVNVRTHLHTYIPCFPGPTVYVGGNNLGKSTAFGAALKAVAYGESSDGLITHNKEEAKIVIHLESGLRLEWTRSLKKSPAVMYRLWKGSELLEESRQKSRNQAPEWVSTTLGISRVDDFDVQIGHQKNPVFLLNEPASRRAQILSVGKESGHLKTLMQEYEKVKDRDRDTVKQGELELARLKVRAGYLERLKDTRMVLSRLVEQSEEMVNALEAREKISGLLATLEALTTKLNAAEAVKVDPIPAIPELIDERMTGKMISTLTRSIQFEGLRPLVQIPALPQLLETQPLLEVGRALAREAALAKALSLSPVSMPEAPALIDVNAITLSVQGIERADAAVRVAHTQHVEGERLVEEAFQALDALADELGGDCPLCGSALAHAPLSHRTHGAMHVH